MQATDGLTERVTRLRSWNAAQSKDNLEFFRFGVPRLREAFRLFTAETPINELYCRKPNRSGGTYTLAAWGIACFQQRPHLHGVPIPQWKGRVEGVQFVLDYKRQLLSVQPAFEKLLGNWPHKIRKTGAAISDIRIKRYGGSDDEREWSVLHFLSEDNPNAAVGIRADVVLIDEPPPIGILQEIRKAAHAGRRSIRVITATPEHMKQWAPLLADYGESPRSMISRPEWWRAEVRWSLDEVEDWVLSKAEKQEMHDAYWTEDGKARDLIADARWHGDYTNAEGSTPWTEVGMMTLLEMLKECRPPDVEDWRISMETEAGEAAKVASVPVQFWKMPEKGKTYYACVDPASGQDDGKHHEAALHVTNLETGELCARWAGYLAPYSLGVLAVGLAKQYNDAWIDIEMKDHWGVNVVRGCTATGYSNVYKYKRKLKTGVWSHETGFDMNEEKKSDVIGRVQEWIDAWGVGNKYAPCYSREVIQCIINCELDERGKVIAGAGLAHGHDVILRGCALARVTRSNRPMPDIGTPAPTPESLLIALIQGKQEYRDPQILPKPRRRTRI